MRGLILSLVLGFSTVTLATDNEIEIKIAKDDNLVFYTQALYSSDRKKCKEKWVYEQVSDSQDGQHIAIVEESLRKRRCDYQLVKLSVRGTVPYGDEEDPGVTSTSMLMRVDLDSSQVVEAPQVFDYTLEIIGWHGVGPVHDRDKQIKLDGQRKATVATRQVKD